MAPGYNIYPWCYCEGIRAHASSFIVDDDDLDESTKDNSMRDENVALISIWARLHPEHAKKMKVSPSARYRKTNRSLDWGLSI